jgi:hypothetical protein
MDQKNDFLEKNIVHFTMSHIGFREIPMPPIQSDDTEEKILAEALFEFTECKLEIARKFRDGIGYGDILEFEKKLVQIDKALAKEEKKLKRSLIDEK